MTAQHTQGPWRVDGSDPYLVIDRNHRAVAMASFRATPTLNPIHETKANARLIAAAPELLEFAEEVRRTGDTRLASMAIAVIAKATGETK